MAIQITKIEVTAITENAVTMNYVQNGETLTFTYESEMLVGKFNAGNLFAFTKECSERLYHHTRYHNPRKRISICENVELPTETANVDVDYTSTLALIKIYKIDVSNEIETYTWFFNGESRGHGWSLTSMINTVISELKLERDAVNLKIVENCLTSKIKECKETEKETSITLTCPVCLLENVVDVDCLLETIYCDKCQFQGHKDEWENWECEDYEEPKEMCSKCCCYDCVCESEYSEIGA